jgi:predicted phage terminase large subunit-like protein
MTTPASRAALERARQLVEELRTREAEVSLHAFVRQAWHVLEPSTPFVDGPHIRAICLHLEAVTRGEIRRLVINMPPRHMKSLLVSVLWPVWVWIRNPSFRWLFGSYALSLSIRDSLKARRLIESPWFRRRWGHGFELTSDQNVKARYENNKTGYRIATSVGAGTTGEGGDGLVIDDAHNIVDVDSAAVRERAAVWNDEAWSTRGNNPATAAFVYVGQRSNEDDLYGHVLAKGGDIVHLCLPAEYEVPRVKADSGDFVEAPKPVNAIGWSDWRAAEGELLWPQRFDAAALAALKLTLGTYGTAGQLQQRPTPRGGTIIQRAWLKYYDELPHDVRDWMQSWDCAFKDEQDSDFVCGGTWCRRGAQIFLVHRVKERLDITGTVDAVRAMTAAYPKAVLKLVEDKANGSAVIQTLKREIAGLVPTNPEASKIARLNACSPTFEAGNVYLPRRAPWLEDYIGELTGFPRAAHDDQVDMTSQAINRYLNPVTVRVW